jgi:serine/threonine protein kinase
MGSPSEHEWPEGHKLAADMDFNFPNFKETSLNSIISSASDVAIDLLKKMMKYNPKDRLTAKECMDHSYFDDVRKYFEPTFKETPNSRYKGNRVTNLNQDPREIKHESRGHLLQAGMNNMQNLVKPEAASNQPYETSFGTPQAHSIRSQPPKRDNAMLSNPNGIGHHIPSKATYGGSDSYDTNAYKPSFANKNGLHSLQKANNLNGYNDQK